MERSLLDIANLADQEDFRKRVAIAFVLISRTILWDEAITDYQSNAYAKNILRMSYETFKPLASFVAADPDTNIMDPSDEEIMEAIKQMWPTLAGVVTESAPTSDQLVNLPHEIQLSEPTPLVENGS